MEMTGHCRIGRIGWLILGLSVFSACQKAPRSLPLFCPGPGRCWPGPNRHFSGNSLSAPFNWQIVPRGFSPNIQMFYFFKGRVYTHMRLLDAADSLYWLVARQAPACPDLWHNLANNAARWGGFVRRSCCSGWS